MKTSDAEKLFTTAVGRSVFKAERHIPKKAATPYGEDVSVHVYPFHGGDGYLWAIRRHGYGATGRDADLAILRAGRFKAMPIAAAARASIAELYKKLPRRASS